MEFGTRSAAHIWCTFMGLVIWITLHVKNLPNILHYMDDAWPYEMNSSLQLYKPYNKFYPSKQVQLLHLWDEISLPHEKSKQVFGPSLHIIGFDIDPRSMSISFPSESKQALISAICDFTNTSVTRRHSLVQWQRLIGWVNWSLNVYPLLKPALQSSYAKIAGKLIPKATVYLNQAIISDLRWLADTIAVYDGLCLLNSVVWGCSDADLIVFCDASLKGLAFYILSFNSAFFSPISQQPPNFHIFFYEALSIVSTLAFCVGLQPPLYRLLIYSDSMNTVDIFHSFKAYDEYNCLLLFAIWLLLPQTTSL